jgi:hypothetical protein
VRAVEARLRRTVFVPRPDADFVVRGEIGTARGGGGWSATIRVWDRSGRHVGARELHSPAKTCEPLSEALGLALALIVESPVEHVTLYLPAPPTAHSGPSPGAIVERAYITVIGTKPGTRVAVKPVWRVKGNPPIPATPAGGTIEFDLGPFDVLNLESDDTTLAECFQTNPKPPYCADFTGSIVQATEPVVVFSGAESSGVTPSADAPKPPLWDEQMGGCCLQHIEEQLPPLESIGKRFVVTRSPVRSNPDLSTYEEPDVLRFVGAAATAQVTTNLPAPFDSFTIKPGQILDTWTQKDIVVSSTEPVFVAQFLVAQGYVNSGQPDGDPSFTIFPPVEQARTEYVFLSPKGWERAYVVIGAEKGTDVTIDGAAPTGCVVAQAGNLDGNDYEARRCQLAEGVHRLSGTAPFGIMAYGYASADSYAFPGGAFFEKICTPPPLY